MPSNLQERDDSFNNYASRCHAPEFFCCCAPPLSIVNTGAHRANDTQENENQEVEGNLRNLDAIPISIAKMTINEYRNNQWEWPVGT